MMIYTSCLQCEFLYDRTKGKKSRKEKEPAPGCCLKDRFINEFAVYVNCKYWEPVRIERREE